MPKRLRFVIPLFALLVILAGVTASFAAGGSDPADALVPTGAAQIRSGGWRS